MLLLLIDNNKQEKIKFVHLTLKPKKIISKINTRTNNSLTKI